MQASRRSRFVQLLAYGVPLLGIVAWLGSRALSPMSEPAACAALAQSRVVHVYAGEGVELRCSGVRVDGAAALANLLRGHDGDALAAALRRDKGSALAVVPSAPGAPVADDAALAARVAGLRHVPSLRAVLLSTTLALYVPAREVELTFAEREALAHVARVLFRGAREPNITSFPPSLRRVERVEVMVMLSQRGEPRLWRSARGTSIARALLTATRVARERWREREQAMGGPLSKRLFELDVEVALLSEDGTLLSPQRAFVDRAVTPLHGVGFDYRTAWHYLLPRDVHKKKDGPFAALSAQITEQGLPLSILSESDTRVYRFVPETLGVSKAVSGEPSAPRPSEPDSL